jgi:hypothetical protein
MPKELQKSINNECHDNHQWMNISKMQGIDWCTQCGAIRTIEIDMIEVIRLPKNWKKYLEGKNDNQV